MSIPLFGRSTSLSGEPGHGLARMALALPVATLGILPLLTPAMALGEEVAPASVEASEYVVRYDPQGGMVNGSTRQTKKEGVPLTLLDMRPTWGESSFDRILTLDANGGRFENGADSVSISESAGSAVTFVQWSGSDGRTYMPGDTYYGDEDLVLTAVTESRGSHSQDPLPVVSRPGYRCVGFFTSRDGGNLIGMPGEEARSYLHDIAYAHWVALANPVTVTYDSNGVGLVGGKPSFDVQAEAGVVSVADMQVRAPSMSRDMRHVTLDANGGTLLDGDDEVDLLVETSYAFSGWTTSPDGFGAVLQAGNRIPATGDVSLYAKWVKTERASMGELPEPVRPGYEFSGWYVSQEDASWLIGHGGDIPAGYELRTLYAHWVDPRTGLSPDALAGTSPGSGAQGGQPKQASQPQGTYKGDLLPTGEGHDGGMATIACGMALLVSVTGGIASVWLRRQG